MPVENQSKSRQEKCSHHSDERLAKSDSGEVGSGDGSAPLSKPLCDGGRWPEGDSLPDPQRHPTQKEWHGKKSKSKRKRKEGLPSPRLKDSTFSHEGAAIESAAMGIVMQSCPRPASHHQPPALGGFSQRGKTWRFWRAQQGFFVGELTTLSSESETEILVDCSFRHGVAKTLIPAKRG
jgi:hypothetical protein